MDIQNATSTIGANMVANATVLSTPTFFTDNVSTYMRKKLSNEIKSFILSSNIQTGFSNLDKIIGKLYPGFYVLGAGSSIGKTTFLLQMADQMINDGKQVIYFTIVQGDFTTNIASINKTVDDYVKATNAVPVIMIDYLQIIQEDMLTDKAKVDYITKSLKILQRKYNTVVIAVSSINRSNYLLQIDFEAFKESGSIEYSADVVWGLQLQILNDPTFAQAKNVSQRRKLIAMAKAASPRKVELVCLKNRYGIASYSCGFLYYPQYDLFTPDISYKNSIVACPTPQTII